MSLLFDMPLLENFSEGIIFLTQEGEITDFNPAARPWVKHCLGAKEQLAALINAAANCRAKTATKVQFLSLGDDPVDRPDMYLVGRKSASGMALVIVPAVAHVSTQTQDSQCTGLFVSMGKNIRHELAQLRTEISKARAASKTPDGRAFSAVLARSERISRLFVVLDQLSELSSGEVFAQQERLSLKVLIHDVLSDLQHHRSGFFFEQVLPHLTDVEGMVYGNCEWLKCGLRGLLDGIGDGIPENVRIRLRMQKCGSFVVLTGGFESATGLSVEPELPMSLDFSRAALTVGRDIRISVVRSIFELHGGHLDVVEVDSGNLDECMRGIESFTLVLPTSAPYLQRRQDACRTCAVSNQTEAYAKDLASLTINDLVSATLSNEELDFLAQVISGKASN